MNVIPFAVPEVTTESFHILVDDQPKLYSHLHQHPQIQITLIRKTEGVLLAGDYVGDFKDGDVFILGPNQPHVFRSSDVAKRQAGASAVSIFFDPNMLGKQFMALPEMRMARIFLDNSQGGFKMLGAARRNVAIAIEKILKAKNVFRMVIFLDILRWLSDLKGKKPLSISSFQKPINEYDHKRITDVVEYTINNSDNAISLSQVAQIAGMTSEAFCKYFRKRTRKTYFQFLNELRINNACKLLMKGGPTVATVSRLVGFNSISNFNRSFKKNIGLTPVEYVYQSVELGKGELP